MNSKLRVSIAAAMPVVSVIVAIATFNAQAQDSASLDDRVSAAQKEAQIADSQQKKATSEAAAATAMHDAQVDSATKDAQLEKAKMDAVASKAAAQKALDDNVKNALPGLPDSRLKIDKPTITSIPSATSRQLYIGITTLGTQVSDKVLQVTAVKNCVGNKTPVTLVVNDSILKVSANLVSSITEALLQTSRQIDALVTQIAAADKPAQAPKRGGGAPAKPQSLGVGVSEAGLAIDSISSLAQTAMGFALALKPQYSTGSEDSTATAQSAVVGALSDALISKGVSVFDPSAIVDVSRAATVQTAVKTLNQSMVAARAELAGSHSTAAGAFVTQLTAAVTAADKMTTSFLTADANGQSPLGQAMRAEIVMDRLAPPATCVFIFDPTIVKSASDTLAKDSFFGGLQVWVNTEAIIKWRVIEASGNVVGAGFEDTPGDWQRQALP